LFAAHQFRTKTQSWTHQTLIPLTTLHVVGVANQGTLCGTGARRAELARLQIPDIDSRRMVIHIRGKGRQDRDVMLSPTLPEALRVYWRGLKRKPTQWLSPPIAEVIEKRLCWP
jgi:Phage integrase family